MNIVNWPSGVNRIVTSDSSLQLGVNGVKSDTTENGSETSRVTGSGVPDVYSVSMTFSNSRHDPFYAAHGKTEWKAFKHWFKFITHNGVNPFYFSCIDDPDDEDGDKCVYKIKSAGLPSGTPMGDHIKVSMQWQEYLTDAITVQDLVPNGNYIDINLDSSFIDFRFNETLSFNPSKSDFTVEYEKDSSSKQPLVIKGLDFDGCKSVSLYVQMPTDPGLYTYYVSYGGKTYHTKIEVEA